MVNSVMILLAGTPLFINYWIAAADYGKQVAQSFLILSSQSKEYVVQGPEALTVDEAAEIYQAHYTKRSLKTAKLPLWVLKAAGLLNRQADYGYHVIKAMIEHPEPFSAQSTWNELGKPTTTMAQFAKNVN